MFRRARSSPAFVLCPSTIGRWEAGLVWAAIATVLFLTGHCYGDDEVYQAPEAFLSESFPETAIPSPSVLWLTSGRKGTVREILGHDYPTFRIRYWRDGDKTAWILEEIGKYKPITTGIVVENGEISRLKVLIYRESHGWEVKFPFFTRQFEGASMRKQHRLDTRIDGIAGATLSVEALKRLSALALFLDQEAQNEE